MNIREKLLAIQTELKVPKNQYNSFGKYNYRSLEDIVESVKPLCDKHKVLFNITDCVVQVGNHNYIRATATIADIEDFADNIMSDGWAKEAESQKGMNPAQVTGSTSSYARKYACNGLFALDDTKDDDTRPPKIEDGSKASKEPPVKTPTVDDVFGLPKLTDKQFKAMKDTIAKGNYTVVEAKLSSYFIEPDKLDLLNKMIAEAKEAVNG